MGLGSVLLALGEPLYDEPGYCQRHAGPETDGNCVHRGDCTLRALWHTLEQWMRHSLDQITIADLLQNEGRVAELVRSRLTDAVWEPPTNLIALNPLLKN
jgi:DNA-binding IscR family transcriptional regulator